MKPEKTINLALQGGGSHGAFAWGVLDRLREDERIGIEGVVGTSAGAMNAAVLAYGLSVGGNRAAREKLREVWTKIGEVAAGRRRLRRRRTGSSGCSCTASTRRRRCASSARRPS
jgi:predicted acylesterase/phospholipase RssA